jgi:hypothetical protein
MKGAISRYSDSKLRMTLPKDRESGLKLMQLEAENQQLLAINKTLGIPMHP